MARIVTLLFAVTFLFGYCGNDSDSDTAETTATIEYSVATVSAKMTQKTAETYLHIINQTLFGYLTIRGQKIYFEVLGL